MSTPSRSTRRTRREPVAVPEIAKPDASLAQMKGIRQHRLNRAETELAESRRRAERARDQMRQARQRWREAQARAETFWQETLASFRTMAITSGEIVLRRRQFEKLREEASRRRLAASQAVDGCRTARAQVRRAQQAVATRRKDAEKLVLMGESQAAA